MKEICFVLTTPYADNAFLLGHLRALADSYHVSLCVNSSLYPISPLLDHRVKVFDIGIERKISPLKDLTTLWKLFCLFRRIGFDAVHSLTPKAGLLAMLAAFLARVPRRYHTFTGQLWVNKTGFGRLFFKRIDWLIAIIASRIFTDSQSQCLLLEREGVVSGGEASVLGLGSICGVDSERFRLDPIMRASTRCTLHAANNTCIFLYVGRLVRDKGVFDLIQAFSKLLGQTDNVALWVVGPDEDGLLQELRELSGLNDDRVFWLDATLEPERYMVAADALILPSYREGFPMVILEAAACGIPSIGYRIDGVIDAIKDGETGVLVPKGSVDALTEAMYSLTKNMSYRNELGRNAIEHVKNNFSGNAVTAAWVCFYRQELQSI
ncbi:MAG: glycosyltransferase family 4 protein [Betaproteobacteria bacterium]